MEAILKWHPGISAERLLDRIRTLKLELKAEPVIVINASPASGVHGW